MIVLKSFVETNMRTKKNVCIGDVHKCRGQLGSLDRRWMVNV
jgi:hypothetical protein